MTWSDNGRAPQAALVVLGVHNVVQNVLLNERGYVTGNLVVSGVLAEIGRSAGLGWADMGLGAGDVRKGLRFGGGVAGVGALCAASALSHPKTRMALRDDRALAESWDEMWYRTLIRFPLGTALFEELAFRGVLPGLFRASRRPWTAEAVSAAAFGLWHMIPTNRALSSNPLGREMSLSRRLAGIVAGSAAAAVSGLGLSWMRRATGSLLAPWLAHSSFNILSYLAGVVALRVSSDARH